MNRSNHDLAISKDDAALRAAAPMMLDTLLLVQSMLDTYRATGAFAAGQPSGWLMHRVNETINQAQGRS